MPLLDGLRYGRVSASRHGSFFLLQHVQALKNMTERGTAQKGSQPIDDLCSDSLEIVWEQANNQFFAAAPHILQRDGSLVNLIHLQFNTTIYSLQL